MTTRIETVTKSERNQAMTRTKLGLLGLCAMVFGLMAFSATGAQAAGTWLILKEAGVVKTGVELPAKLELEKDSAVYVLHSEILKIKVLFLCTEIKVVNAMIFGAGAIGKGPGEEKESKVLFSGCVTDLNGVEEPKCKPIDPNDGSGFIVTEFGHALAELHKLEVGGALDDIVKILPDEGNTFAKIVLPAGCVIGTSVPVIGTLALKDCENIGDPCLSMALTHLVKHLVEPFTPLTKLFTISETTEHAATLLGSAWARLGGEHAPMAWSISGL
jgi:hypothetical protein